MLINCVVYQQGRKVRDISIAEISEWIGRGDSFVWVALKDASVEEMLTMQQEFNLHELAVEDAHHGHQRPKIEEYNDSLFAVLQMITLLPNGELQLGEVNIFVGKDYVLSVRNHSDQGFLGVRARAEREPHLLQHGSGFVFYALMDAVVDRYLPIIDALETELETIEHYIFEKGAARANIRRLYELKQKMILLRHAVMPLMTAVGKLYGGRVPELCSATQEYFRDVYDHLYRVNLALDAMRETIATAMQVNLSMVAIEQSDVAKRLASWAAIFGAATSLVGVWGMNFEHMPELQWVYGYPLSLASVTIVCGVLYWRFKKAHWL
jgi:magnesium transporter